MLTQGHPEAKIQCFEVNSSPSVPKSRGEDIVDYSSDHYIYVESAVQQHVGSQSRRSLAAEGGLFELAYKRGIRTSA